MAQFTLDSKETMSRLVSLAKTLADAIGWVGQHRKNFKIEIPDDLWHHYGGLSIRSGVHCPDIPQRMYPTCLLLQVPERRAEVEILLGVLTKMGTKGTQRPKTKRRK